MTHAGFWVDGAVRQPDEKHRDKIGCVLVRWKNDSQYDFDVMLSGFRDWRRVYWLDTTPRESLTPEELFSVLKTAWAGCGTLRKNGDASWYLDEIVDGVKVDWGNITQYPPSVEPQWVRVTRENVGQYMFRECRCGDIPYSGIVAGWRLQDDCCLVSCVVNDGEESIIQFTCVEVLDAPPT